MSLRDLRRAPRWLRGLSLLIWSAVFGFIVGAIIYLYLRGSLFALIPPAIALFLIAPVVGVLVIMVLAGIGLTIGHFYYPPRARRWVVISNRAIRNLFPNRYDRNSMIVDVQQGRCVFRASRALKGLVEGVTRGLQLTLIGLLVPTVIGLLAPRYGGPTPPNTAIHRAHATVSHMATAVTTHPMPAIFLFVLLALVFFGRRFRRGLEVRAA